MLKATNRRMKRTVFSAFDYWMTYKDKSKFFSNYSYE